MDEIMYEGKIYRRYGNKWTDSMSFAVCEDLQRKLNLFFLKNVDLTDMECMQIIKYGDDCKATKSYALAIRFYEAAVETANKRDVTYIMPRITSCYRLLGHPEKAIELLSTVKKKHGVDIISPPLLTSAAAAYCDMQEYENATKCANRACAMCKGKCDPELISVFKRIKSEK